MIYIIRLRRPVLLSLSMFLLPFTGVGQAIADLESETTVSPDLIAPDSMISTLNDSLISRVPGPSRPDLNMPVIKPGNEAKILIYRPKEGIVYNMPIIPRKKPGSVGHLTLPPDSLVFKMPHPGWK